MLFIVNKNIPADAKKKLKYFGQVILFETSGITYPAISSHPDIFFCIVDDKLVYAPNVPQKYIEQIEKAGINIRTGSSSIKSGYPLSAKYNAVTTKEYLIHNKKITDDVIADFCLNKKHLDVKQGYTRCNLLPLKSNHFITSDRGIEKKLLNEGLQCLFVKPEGILLPGFAHGFFGGTCGVYEDLIFITGNLKNLSGGEKIKCFLNKFNYNIIELYDGKLFDVGSILII